MDPYTVFVYEIFKHPRSSFQVITGVQKKVDCSLLADKKTCKVESGFAIGRARTHNENVQEHIRSNRKLIKTMLRNVRNTLFPRDTARAI